MANINLPRRIIKETQRLLSEPGYYSCWVMKERAPGISASPSEDNMRYSNVMIFGLTQSPYEGTGTTPIHSPRGRAEACCSLDLTRLLEVHAHDESCRTARFIDSGRVILTASADCSILATDVESGNPIVRLEEAHEDPVNRLVNLTENTVATGDDEGFIKVWDTRERTCCNSFDAHEDYISDMTFVSSSMQLLATSGDGTLSVCDIRKRKVKAQSEFSEDELLSIVVMKNGRKVICGTQTGALLLYSWGYFKDCSDRLIGHPMSVTVLKLDEDTLISGADDGVISFFFFLYFIEESPPVILTLNNQNLSLMFHLVCRLVGILPNRIIQPIAEHSECPVEGLAFSHDRKFLGSISHDPMLKLWDLQELLDGQHNQPNHEASETDSDDDEMDVDVKPPTASKGSKRKADKGQRSKASAPNFFADL